MVHNKMTIAIRYKIPYIVQDRGPFILPFALWHDLSLRYFLGLPTPLSMETSINLLSGKISCIWLNRKFLLTLYPPGKELPNGTTLNKYSPFILTIPLQVLIVCNILPKTVQQIHYGMALHRKKLLVRTVFRNIMFHEKNYISPEQTQQS